MEPLTDTRKYSQNRQFLAPGPVGSIGDVNLNVKFKHSMPDLPPRYDPEFSGQDLSNLGNNVSDGQEKSFETGGMGDASVITYGNWGGKRDFQKGNIWRYQDLRVADRRMEPIMGDTPQYLWHNKIATVYEARRTGQNFLPVPGEYAISPGEVPRGSTVPGPVDTVGDPGVIAAMGGQSVVTNPQAGGSGLYPMPGLRAGISPLGQQYFKQ